METLSADDPRLRKRCKKVSLRELRTNKVQDLIEEMLAFVCGKNNKGVERNKR